MNFIESLNKFFFNNYKYLVTAALVVVAGYCMSYVVVSNSENSKTTTPAIKPAETILVGATAAERNGSNQSAIDYINEQISSCDCVIENESLLYLKRAEYESSLGNYQAATDSYSQALAFYEEYPDPRIVYEYAQAAANSGNSELALQQFTFLQSLLDSEHIQSYQITQTEVDKIAEDTEQFLAENSND